MQQLKILVLGSFLLISNVICMELEKDAKVKKVEKKLKAELDKARITLCKDVALEDRFEPFIGKVVAYEIPDSYPTVNKDMLKLFGNNRIKLACHPDSKPSVYYGYVEDKKFYDRSVEMIYRWSRQKKCLVRQLDEVDHKFLSDNQYNYIMHTLLQTYPCKMKNKNCSDYKGMWYCCNSQFQNLCPEPSHIIHYGFLDVNMKIRNITAKEAANILKIIKEDKTARFTYWVRQEFSLPSILAYLELLIQKQANDEKGVEKQTGECEIC